MGSVSCEGISFLRGASSVRTPCFFSRACGVQEVAAIKSLTLFQSFASIASKTLFDAIKINDWSVTTRRKCDHKGKEKQTAVDDKTLMY